MTPKATSHVIQGMQKDTSKSKLSKEFAFDAKNIRITAREDNSLLTVTNEKGNKKRINLSGYYIGHCVLNNQLVLFTTTPKEDNKDHILLYDSNFNQSTLYNGNLNFSIDNPLETLGVYENEDIQKVYWVDGRNQPRVINIKVSEDIRNKWSDSSFDFIPELKLEETVKVEAINTNSLFAPGVIQYAFSYYNKYGQESNIFDTTPLYYLAHNNRGASPGESITDRAFKITVNNVDTNFDYIRIYSIHRTSIDAVPTVKRVIDLPISIPKEYKEVNEFVTSYNLGSINKAYLQKAVDDNLPGEDLNNKLLSGVVAPISETPDQNTTINTYNLNSIPIGYNIIIGSYNNGKLIAEKEIKTKDFSKLQYIETIRTLEGSGRNTNIYTYKLISTDSEIPFIVSYKIKNEEIPSISYIDNGTLGEAIDPTQLLYTGGESIIAGCITQNSNTLFLGNIKLSNKSIPDDIKESIKNSVNKVEIGSRYKKYNNIKSSDIYKFNTLTEDNTYFRAGEHYRLGIQFQYKNGKWSEPVYIGDVTQAVTKRPEVLEDGITFGFPKFDYTISDNIKTSIKDSGFIKMRGLVVFPEMNERKIIAQGIICPTLYNTNNRLNNNPYSQASWFFRPNMHYDIDDIGFNNASENNIKLGSIVEFRHGKPLLTNKDRGSEIQNEVEYKVDQSIINFYSPDLEFNKDYYPKVLDNLNFKIVGLVNFTSNYGDIDITTKTPPLAMGAVGFFKQKLTSVNSGERSLVSGLFYNDAQANTVDRSASKFYLVKPWQKSGSLNNDTASIASNADRTQSSILNIKKISNYKISSHNTWLNYTQVWSSLSNNSNYDSFANGISSVYKVCEEEISLTKIKLNNEYLNYYGNIDDLITTNGAYNINYGNDFYDTTIYSLAEDIKDPVRMKYKTGPHFVFKLKNAAADDSTVILPTFDKLNIIDSVVEYDTQPITNYGSFIKYSDMYTIITIRDIKDASEGDLAFIEHDIRNEDGQKTGSYIDVCQYKSNEWRSASKEINKVYYYIDTYVIKVYKRSSGVDAWEFDEEVNIRPTQSEKVTIKQDIIKGNVPSYPYLFLAELYTNPDYTSQAFGGTSEEAIKNNSWIPAGDSVPIDSGGIEYKYGDTRYQRYDCLKTYAFTPEDENQVIEVASFLCETRVNMLGRYDKNIGNLSNLNADPTNFNLFNPVYSQKDNFFNYRILDSDVYKLNNFPNSITWSKEKHLGEDVDTWTNITMASTLDLDGTKGKVNKLITFKDQIFAFQDKGISNILFNSRVQIPVSDGVPVEISNGMKVDGSRYISDNIGCQNKNSIVTTPSGVYFLDSESNGIYLLTDGLTNLSTNKGFDIWTKEVSKDPSFKSFYDKNEKDVYFTTKDYCLGYSEKLGQFTSFYDYTDVETMFNIGTGFYSIKDQNIYQHSAGNYNEFYGEIKPYHLTIISNEDPQVDKVFTNLNYRADFFDSNNNYLENESFDTLEVWNEYQRGKETLNYSKFRPSNLKKKFRMWGANIPRDEKNKLDRMRNPWLYIKLSKENPGTSKMELHDLVVKYLE